MGSKTSQVNRHFPCSSWTKTCSKKSFVNGKSSTKLHQGSMFVMSTGEPAATEAATPSPAPATPPPCCSLHQHKHWWGHMEPTLANTNQGWWPQLILKCLQVKSSLLPGYCKVGEMADTHKGSEFLIVWVIQTLNVYVLGADRTPDWPSVPSEHLRVNTPSESSSDLFFQRQP